MNINFWFFGATDIGAVRSNNQDSILYLSGQAKERQLGLAIVADGMGGLSAGEIASQMVVKSFENWWYQTMPSCLEKENIWRSLSISLDICISQVNSRIYEMARENGQTMGTTLTLAFLVDKQVLIKNIGDSRGYFLRENELIAFTRDDSYQQQFRDQGFTEEELRARNIAQNILTKCIGVEENVIPDSQLLWLNQDIVLCSDGVYQYIAPNILAQYLRRITMETAKQVKEKIKEEIYRNGAGDNWSYIYIKKME